MDKDIFEVGNQVFKTDMRFENDLIPKTETLLDGYKQNAEQSSRIEEMVIYP